MQSPVGNFESTEMESFKAIWVESTYEPDFRIVLCEICFLSDDVQYIFL